VHAELAYLFRHALMCDAAYQLQLHSDRARLHALALAIVEEVLDVSPPPIDHDAAIESPYVRLVCDTYATELAHHARQALDVLSGPALAAMRNVHAAYLWRAAEHLTHTYQNEAAARAWKLLASDEALTAQRRSEAMRRACAQLEACSKFDEALECGKSALSAAKATRNASNTSRVQVAAQLHLGLIYDRLGKSAETARLFRRALAEAKKLGDTMLQSLCLRGLSNSLVDTKRQDEALKLLEQAIELSEKNGDARGVVLMRASLGTRRLARGEFAVAEHLLRDSIGEFRKAEDHRLLVPYLNNLATLLGMTGRAEEGHKTRLEALELAKITGNRRGEGILIGNLAAKQQERGESLAAIDGFRQALAIAREIGNVPDVGINYGNLGACYFDLGRYAEAERYFLRGLEIARKVGDKRLEGSWLCHVAIPLLYTGRRSEGEARWHEGEQLLAEINDSMYLPKLRKEWAEHRAKLGHDA
jgi:tetratricopeptide (TPR) repeat protein